MNDLGTNASGKPEANNTGTAKVIYILLIVSTIIGITGIIGLIMAYVMHGDADDWLKTHYRFQIRTFWIGLLYTMVGAFLLTVNIGYVILLFTFVWLIVRCAKGLRALEKNMPVANAGSWLFG
jgi:uncharacterized membrane protein